MKPYNIYLVVLFQVGFVLSCCCTRNSKRLKSNTYSWLPHFGLALVITMRVFACSGGTTCCFATLFDAIWELIRHCKCTMEQVQLFLRLGTPSQNCLGHRATMLNFCYMTSALILKYISNSNQILGNLTQLTFLAQIMALRFSQLFF